jgi:hypothetical protein
MTRLLVDLRSLVAGHRTLRRASDSAAMSIPESPG